MDTQIFRSKHLTLKLDGSIMVMTYANDLAIDLEVAKIMVAERLSAFRDQRYAVLVDAGLSSLQPKRRSAISPGAMA